MKGSFFNIPSLPVGKVGFVLGSVIAGQWIVNDLVHIPSGGLAVLAAGAGAWFLSKPPKRGTESQT